MTTSMTLATDAFNYAAVASKTRGTWPVGKERGGWVKMRETGGTRYDMAPRCGYWASVSRTNPREMWHIVIVRLNGSAIYRGVPGKLADAKDCVVDMIAGELAATYSQED